MESAIGVTSWLVDKVLNKLSNYLVPAYVASSELGLNSDQIIIKLKHMAGLLHAARERDVSSNPALQSLLEDLRNKADEAEDVLDELYYFMVQDQLDGTPETAPEKEEVYWSEACSISTPSGAHRRRLPSRSLPHRMRPAAQIELSSSPAAVAKSRLKRRLFKRQVLRVEPDLGGHAYLITHPNLQSF